MDAPRELSCPAPELLHILLFQCPRCAGPLAALTLSDLWSFESVDGANFKLSCACGWSSEQLGAAARKHLLEPWPEHTKANHPVPSH